LLEHLADEVHGGCSDVDDKEALECPKRVAPITDVGEMMERLQRLGRSPVDIRWQRVYQHIICPLPPTPFLPRWKMQSFQYYSSTNIIAITTVK